MSLIPVKIKTIDEQGRRLSQDGYVDDIANQLIRPFPDGRVIEVRQLGFIETLYPQFVEPEPQQKQ